MVKTFKHFPLNNQLTDGLQTWYEALGTRVLPELFSDGKVKYDKNANT